MVMRLVFPLGIIGFVLSVWIVAAPVRAATVTDTTVADFNAGTVGACYIGDDTGGEVLLTPTLATEFSGVALPSGWTAHLWPPGGSVSVSGGTVTVLGYDVYPPDTYNPITSSTTISLEFKATFAAQIHQTIGFGSGTVPFDNFPLLAIGTAGQTTNVNALIWDTGANTPIPLHPVDGLPHRYRIDWQASTVSYWVDDMPILAATAQPHGVGTESMHPAISDFESVNPLVVDWLRVIPYTTPCAYTSAVIDGGNAAAHWTTLATTPLLFPPGTSVSIETQTGNVLVPDGSWSGFAPVVSGAIASPNARYLQYRATLSTMDSSQTPELQQVAVSYDACTPTGPEICDNGLDDDCDGVDAVCTPTVTPTVTPTPTETPVPATLTLTPTVTPVPPTHTQTPTVTPGLCGNGNVDPGEQCDDGNTANGDCCNSTCHFEPAGSPCNDHNTCTNGETCNAFGVCRGFTSCNTTFTCNFCGSKCTLSAGVCKCG